MLKKIVLDEKDRKELTVSIKKIIGQLQSISTIIDNNNISDQTFTQLLAVKGGASRICKEIITKGVLSNIKSYSIEDLEKALNVIFKLD